jgi:hypothetical protein
MASNKKFTMGKGKYYFNVKTGQANIMINRSSKKDAERVFNSYVRVGKQVEWLGKWTGKKFTEEKTPEPA